MLAPHLRADRQPGVRHRSEGGPAVKERSCQFCADVRSPSRQSARSSPLRRESSLSNSRRRRASARAGGFGDYGSGEAKRRRQTCLMKPLPIELDLAADPRMRYASTRITKVSGSTPSYAIASAPASVCIAAITASMSGTSISSPTRFGFCGSTKVRMPVTPSGPKNSSRFGEASHACCPSPRDNR